MDSLVAQYTRPAYTEEGQSYEEQQELAQATPELSLKFALPPVAQVCSFLLERSQFSAPPSILC
jgi:20S proteasome subunit beta 5